MISYSESKLNFCRNLPSETYHTEFFVRKDSPYISQIVEVS